jgi:hypothetical protein
MPPILGLVGGHMEDTQVEQEESVDRRRDATLDGKSSLFLLEGGTSAGLSFP